jgi:multifunctional methyltransferase subunit TRM112
MRLITHNLLKSNVRGVESFPLKIEAEEIREQETEYSADFIHNMLPKLDWPALREGAAALSLEELPETVSDEDRESDEFLRKVHHILLEVQVVSGALVCPKTGRRYQIKDGIPNMLLHEDEL